MNEELLDALNALNITMCRVYDTTMALVALHDEDTADYLQEQHDRGGLVGSPPYVTATPFTIPETLKDKQDKSL